MLRPNPAYELQCTHEHKQDACDYLRHQEQSYHSQHLKCVVRIRHKLEKESRLRSVAGTSGTRKRRSSPESTVSSEAPLTARSGGARTPSTIAVQEMTLHLRTLPQLYVIIQVWLLRT
jgi:cation transport regulator ChaC